MQSSSFARSPSQQANESVVNEDEEELLQDRAEPKMENDTGAGAVSYTHLTLPTILLV